MIDETYLKDLGLTKEQTQTVLNAMNKERVYQSILCEEGIQPRVALKIMNCTRLDEIADEPERVLRLKVQETWKDFIPKKKK